MEDFAKSILEFLERWRIQHWTHGDVHIHRVINNRVFNLCLKQNIKPLSNMLKLKIIILVYYINIYYFYFSFQSFSWFVFGTFWFGCKRGSVHSVLFVLKFTHSVDQTVLETSKILPASASKGLGLNVCWFFFCHF